MTYFRLIRIVSSFAAVAFVLSTLAPAAGALIIKNDHVSINFGTADFGSGVHAGGTPTGSGTVRWDFSTVNGSLVATARVRGQLYHDSLDPGCARLTIAFLSTTGSTLNTRTKTLCVTETGKTANDATNKLTIDESYNNSELKSVVLRTHVIVNNQIVSSSPPIKSIAPVARRYDHVIMNQGTSDFGGSPHATGVPGPGAWIQLHRLDGTVSASATGVLYYDALFGSGCTRLFIDFEKSDGSKIKTVSRRVCGNGGDANDSVNKLNIVEVFKDGSLMQIRLRIGPETPDGRFTLKEQKVYTFVGSS